ncbi:MAG: YggS family pyridoxal phosphate-dependent enzyme [Gammaproteobacteria bacterium]|nr:YggS family pyridoxal phosphate-dependent enzyme [Gammaproteobacteria bacterium]MCW8988619.1 YggS family pyridoxal phosphate-dependent enzyme [Gammaproteobacteria bacterium]MCW9031653.1 YggS family pyridoxal phosphate-dependent enzyme [Gammaproteobacteria bacterium]
MNHASKNTIAENIKSIRSQVAAAEKKYGRQPGSVQLLAVSKTRPIEDVEAAFAEHQCHFGENYLQDALPKIAAISDSAITWHFIGPIQSNKTRQIAENFDWVHGIERLNIAQRLNEQRDPTIKPLNVCIQVNSSNETSKSGVSFAEAIELAKSIHLLPNLHLRGLMTIPAATNDFEQQRQPFRLLRELKDKIHSQGIKLDTLSMGMSNDMEAAIAEGSTLVRIGTAIFGQRN